MSNGFTNAGKENILNVLTSNNYPNESVNQVLGSPQYVKSGSSNFYQELITEFPDLQIVDLLPNNDKFLGYGNFTNSDGKLQGIMFIINDQLQLQTLSYQDSSGNLNDVTWLTTYDYQGNEITLPILQKLKIDNNGYVYGIIQRDPDADHPNYNYLWYLVKFNDFLSTWFNNFELFLIGDFLVSDNIQINNNTSIENSYILDTPILDISQNETNDDYYQIIYVKKAPNGQDQNSYNLVVNVVDLQNNKFVILSDVNLSNINNSLNLETVGTKSIQLEGAYDSENNFYGAILVTSPINIMNLIPHTMTVTDGISNWSTGINNTFQYSDNSGQGETQYYSGSANAGNLDKITEAHNQYKSYDNYQISITQTSGNFSINSNNFGVIENTTSWNNSPSNFYVRFDTNETEIRYGAQHTSYGGDVMIVTDTGSVFLVGSWYGNYNAINMNKTLSVSISSLQVTAQIDYDERVYTISQNGVLMISIKQNADTNYLVDATVKQALYNNESALTPQLINSSTGYISIQKIEDDSYGIYKFTTDTNSTDLTNPLLLNSDQNFINNESIYIATIKNQDVQDTTIIGINNPDSKNVIGLNLYKKSNDLNPSQISFIQETFDADQPSYNSVIGLRQQNKIFIFGFDENFANYCLFINEYSNGTPDSKPYFFLPYENINTNFLLTRVQGQDSNAIIAADVNIEDSAFVNNNFVLNAVLEQYTMNNVDNSIWYIINQSNNEMFFSDETISKSIMEEKQVSFNVLINYINQTDNVSYSDLSIKLAQLFTNDEMTTDFLNKIYIKTMRLTFKNGSTQELDIPWEIDLINYEANANFTLEFSNTSNDLTKLEYLYADGSVNWTKTFTDENANKFIKIKSNIKFENGDES